MRFAVGVVEHVPDGAAGHGLFGVPVDQFAGDIIQAPAGGVAVMACGFFEAI